MADREAVLDGEVDQAVAKVQRADIVIGIPSYNNEKTIGHVVQAAHAGLLKYFPQFSAVIVNSDGASRDGTRQAVLGSRIEDSHLLLLHTPLRAVHRLSFPYHGIPGKGSAFRLIFQVAKQLGAKACAVVDADLRSITPEWIDLLIRPVLLQNYDFVAPYYYRHKFDGTITNNIVYPLTRALYGHRIRQPIGGEFGLSAAIVQRYLERNDWQTDVARFGIDIWMTTIALAERFRVCQSFLGAKLHDAKDPGSDLSAMLTQVLSSVFALMDDYQDVWAGVQGSQPVDLFGFRFDVGLEPIPVNIERMLRAFAQSGKDLAEVWRMALPDELMLSVESLIAAASQPDAGVSFRVADPLWARIVYAFACACRRLPMERSHILKSFTPLYLARVTSTILETREMNANEFEERMERLCLSFEAEKAYLLPLWLAAAKPK